MKKLVLPWSSPASLTAMTPLADRDVVYTFHTYNPMISPTRARPGPHVASVHVLAFPANAENVQAVAARAETTRQEELAAYGCDYADDHKINREIDAVSSWARRYGVASVATEFGVYDMAPPTARAAWVAVVRREFEARGIGWTVREYRGGFGIAPDLRRGCAAPDSAAKALGLCGE